MHGKITIKYLHKKLQIILHKLDNATKLHMKPKSLTHSHHFGADHFHCHCWKFINFSNVICNQNCTQWNIMPSPLRIFKIVASKF